MSRSNHATGQISTYRFPDEVSIDGLLVRPPLDADIDEIAPAFRDPAVGGEAGLPPVDADTLRVMLHEQLPDLANCTAARRFIISIRYATSSRSGTGSSSTPGAWAWRPEWCAS